MKYVAKNIFWRLSLFFSHPRVAINYRNLVGLVKLPDSVREIVSLVLWLKLNVGVDMIHLPLK